MNLADDPELLQLMAEAGFVSVFLGIETPDESSLKAAQKLQNTRRDLLASIAAIQRHGIQVMGGFILGFDTDREDIFDRMVDFIQKSGIPIAMVGLLQAMPGTQLFRRLWNEGRFLDTGDGNNTDFKLNFRPRMDAARLVQGYSSVLQRIYSCEPYYERVKLFLSRYNQRQGQRITFQNARALVTSILRQGLFSKHRLSYWKFLAAALTRYRPSFGEAMTLAVMGYHFQVMTRRLLKSAATLPILPPSLGGSLPPPASEATV